DVPGENHFPYTWASALHIRTRAAVIRRQLLMRRGDYVDRDLMEEAERNLRALPFIREATIVEIPVSKTEADLLVKTQDTWTTLPQIDFGSEGGQSHFSAGIEEDNLLGFGKTASYFYRRDHNGISNQVAYQDPQIGNTRLTLNSSFAKTAFGNEEHFNLSRPFYSLETRYAGGGSVDHVLTTDQVNNQGSQLTEYRSNYTQLDLFGGVKLNNSVVDIYRLTVHYNYTGTDYYSNAGTTAGTLPRDNALSGPVASGTLNQNHF